MVLTVLGKGLNARTGDQMEIEPIVPGTNSTGLPKGQCQKLSKTGHSWAVYTTRPFKNGTCNEWYQEWQYR